MRMKTAVSIPDPVFRSADELAARLRISRSELYSRALAAMVDEHRESLITRALECSLWPWGDRLEARTWHRGDAASVNPQEPLNASFKIESRETIEGPGQYRG